MNYTKPIQFFFGEGFLLYFLKIFTNWSLLCNVYSYANTTLHFDKFGCFETKIIIRKLVPTKHTQFFRIRACGL
jgi:hypothetical protein